MRALVVLAFIALAGCQNNPQKFDLVCEGSLIKNGEQKNNQTIRLSIDLDTRFWCYTDGCDDASLSMVQAISPQYFVLDNDIRVDRREATIQARWDGGEFSGPCEKARFTRPPKTKL